MSDYLDPNNEELLHDFFAEAASQVELLESSILALEKDPSDRDAVDELFRAAHTLKGACATVQMDEMTSFTHQIEDALDDIRSASAHVTPALVDLLLASVDIIKTMLACRSDGRRWDGEITAITDGLARESGAEPVEALPGSGSGSRHMDTLDDAAGPVLEVRVEFDESNPMNSVGGIQVYAALKEFGAVLQTEPDFDALYSDDFHPVVTYYLVTDAEPVDVEAGIILPDVTIGITVSRHGAGEPVLPEREVGTDEPVSQDVTAAPSDEQPPAEPADPAVPRKPALQSGAASRPGGTPGGSVLRVDSRRVDELLNLVSEVVINKAAFNQVATDMSAAMTDLAASEQSFRDILRELFDALPEYLERMQQGASARQIKREIGDRFGRLYGHFDQPGNALRRTVAGFRATAANLARMTSELQEGVMRIRMVPISQIFSRFPRLVRDLTRSLDKEVELRIEGEETELDKSVIEDLLDPLIHCVRNSIDHGIESPNVRGEQGKTPAGELLLRASSEGNTIVIEIADDGRGIDVEAVRRKAVDRGIIHPGKALSDLEAFNLVFEPGFSTARQVSSISGRGVGLDVVRKQIEKLNGSVTVSSEAGKGTKFTIRIPLTLAIIQGLMVKVGGHTYAIPITSVIESHRILAADIRRLDNYEVLNVREDVVSLLRLSRIFRIDTAADQQHLYVVVVGSGEKKVGLVVDSLIGEEDVVIRPLRDRYTNVPGIAGANITGDGRVSLIIDVAELLELGLRHERDARRRREAVIGA